MAQCILIISTHTSIIFLCFSLLLLILSFQLFSTFTFFYFLKWLKYLVSFIGVVYRNMGTLQVAHWGGGRFFFLHQPIDLLGGVEPQEPLPLHGQDTDGPIKCSSYIGNHHHRHISQSSVRILLVTTQHLFIPLLFL